MTSTYVDYKHELDQRRRDKKDYEKIILHKPLLLHFLTQM